MLEVGRTYTSDEIIAEIDTGATVVLSEDFDLTGRSYVVMEKALLYPHKLMLRNGNGFYKKPGTFEEFYRIKRK